MVSRGGHSDPVRAALRRLIDHGLTADLDIDQVVPAEIQSSWRRSIASKVDPAGEPRVEDFGAREELISQVAARVMDRWYSSLTNTRATLLLGNAEGRIVWRRTIDARDHLTLDRVGAVEGGDFSESASGTNGLGTSIEARSPILVRGGQHFLESLRNVACAAAPVIHPLTGRIVGSVSLTVAAEQANDYMVAVARQASREIADVLLHGSDSEDMALALAFRKARSHRRGVLVMNRDAIMSDLPALSRIDTETHAQIWDQLVGRLGGGEQRRINLPEVGLAGLVTNIGTNSEPVLELRTTAVETPPQQRTAASKDRVEAGTARGTPAPPQDADDAVRSWWEAMNQVAQQVPQPLAVGVPPGSDGQQWVRRWSQASGQPGRAVVTAASPREGAPHEARGAPAFPPLRRRRSGLATLVKSCYQGKGPAPRFSSEAFRALLAWSWPGDVAELAELVNGLSRRSTGAWLVEATDLPPHFLALPRRELTRWEQAERDSMLEALAEAEGNKSDAAALLGIGRTTLYRKLRSLSIDQDQIDALVKRPLG
ncbi:helix-turn-helix domain-containing protein [Nesterenkonia muleiensis]|uniref:helix-turn-helix domain-containing protein n=1 Tax=Nesterenkonia muleiensis TaxID=2282648 RepID=UPI000E72E1B1|nr:helix-turn-helix domain-containing protein [Nesterenkonia muleiensis]